MIPDPKPPEQAKQERAERELAVKKIVNEMRRKGPVFFEEVGDTIMDGAYNFTGGPL